MKKIGMLTIGQTPRDDIVPSLMDILGDDYEIIQAGALDDKSFDDVSGIDISEGDHILVTRMREGTEVKITKKYVLPLMQKKLSDLEEKGIRLTVVMCTGEFPQFDSKGLVLTPKEILGGMLKSALKEGKLGVVYPAKEQLKMAEDEFGRPGVEIYADWLSPYGGKDDIKSLIKRLSFENLDLILLNCFGFNSAVREAIFDGTGVPTIQSNSLVARVLKELT